MTGTSPLHTTGTSRIPHRPLNVVDMSKLCATSSATFQSLTQLNFSRHLRPPDAPDRGSRNPDERARPVHTSPASSAGVVPSAFSVEPGPGRCNQRVPGHSWLKALAGIPRDPHDWPAHRWASPVMQSPHNDPDETACIRRVRETGAVEHFQSVALGQITEQRLLHSLDDPCP